MLRKLVCSTLAAVLLGAFLAAVPVAAPAARAAELPPMYLTQWGTNGTGNSQFVYPRGVAVDGAGNVYVADTYNHRIQKFTPTGTYLTQWGTNGTGNGQFAQPQGVAVDGTGNVYVADTYNHRIQKFTSTGTYLTQWGTNGTGNGQFVYPTGLGVDGAGDVYVADTYNHRIQKFTPTGTYLTQWGTSGTGNGQFAYPRGVAIDGTGNVFVVDTVNHRVQKFTSTGTYLTQWGTNGTGNGQFTEPRGLAVDGAGNVYVADRDNDRIQKFTSTGTYLTQWGTSGAGDGQFNTPEGVAVDGTGNAYVADTYNHRIQKFTPVAPAVTIAKSADETEVTAGSPIHYHLTVTNTGNVPLTGVVLTDAAAPACSGTLADIAVGSSRVVDCSHTTTLYDVGTYANTASVDTNETDAVTSNTRNVTVTAAAQSSPPPVFVRTWGSAGTGNGQFNAPDAVAWSPTSGDVYVADRNNNRVQEFTREGVFVRTWGTSGTGNGQFLQPTGIAVNAAGEVYVTELVNNRVQQFTATGTWIRTFGAGTLSSPEGIAVAPDGTVYVADAAHGKIQRFSGTGTLLGSIGTPGTAPGQLSYAQGVAASDTAVYVADTYNRRVQQFTPAGAYVRGWGASGSANGQFKEVDGIALLANGNVVVTDPNNTRLQVFTATGTFVTTWGTTGTGDGQFVAPSPADVATTSDGWVYVVDRTSSRIQQFAPSVIRGTITQSLDGGALSGTWVAALRSSDYQLVGGTITDAGGQYSLPVSPGSYRLEFIDPLFRHDLEFYDDKGYSQLATSTPVTATLGAATTGIDAALFLPTGVITGTIIDGTTGSGMADAGVAVMSTSDYHPYAAVFSAAGGAYRVTGLPPGEYWVVAATPDGTHEPTFVGGTHAPQGATRLAVTADHTTNGADITLTPVTDGIPTATLQGTLTDEVNGQVEPGVLVAALRAADFAFTVAGFTDAAGHYQLTVPTGNYYLEFFDLDHGHEFEWYHDQPHPTDPSQLTVVTAPGTADEHLIPLQGTAAGTVTDAVSGSALAGGWVAALSSTDGHGVAGTTTAANGTWTIPGLDIGQYYVVYIDSSGRHALEFHDNSLNITTATPVPITGSHTTTITAGLAPTG